MVIGDRLVPIMAESKALPALVFVAAAATLGLKLLPIELWVLPLLVLCSRSGTRLAAYAAGGIFTGMVSLFLLASWSGSSGAVSFIVEIEGLRAIHDYQQIRETTGAWAPLLAGLVGPPARVLCVMAAQRELVGGPAFILLAAAHASIRWMLMMLACRLLVRKADLAARFAVPWWCLLALVDLIRA